MRDTPSSTTHTTKGTMTSPNHFIELLTGRTREPMVWNTLLRPCAIASRFCGPLRCKPELWRWEVLQLNGAIPQAVLQSLHSSDETHHKACKPLAAVTSGTLPTTPPLHPPPCDGRSSNDVESGDKTAPLQHMSTQTNQGAA